MSTDVFTADLRTTLHIVDEWLTSYITQPHEQIGRPGAVCPFVAPARRVEVLRTVVRLLGPAASPSLMTEIIRYGLDEFEQIEWGTVNPAPRSLLIVLPDLPPEAFGILEDAHAMVKSESVERGLMIGQFHPMCDEPAVRNPAFPVSRSPVPLVAVWLMAVHGILFLGERADWSAHYHCRRFGARHRRQSNGIDSMLTRLYNRALALYGPSGVLEAATVGGASSARHEGATE